MADDRINSLKIALTVIPDYDGNANQLHRFITTCETVLTQYFDVAQPNHFNNQVLLHSVLNKLKGKAEEVVTINGVFSWNEIKQVLIKNFADQRDENCLNRDLINMRQDNETTQEFYNRCMHMLSTIINYVNLHEQDENKKICKREFFSSQTLKTFLSGLKDPLGVTIRTMRPEDMPTALQYIKEEENIHYLQKRQGSQNNFQKPLDLNKFGPHNLPPRPVAFPNLNRPLYSERQNFSQNNYRPVYPNPYENNQWNRPQYPYNPSRQFSRPQSNNKPGPSKPMSGFSYRSANIPLRPYMPINNHTCQTTYQTNQPATAFYADTDYAAARSDNITEKRPYVCDTDYLANQQYYDNFDEIYTENETNQDFCKVRDTDNPT
jgi:hypothetical protein